MKCFNRDCPLIHSANWCLQFDMGYCPNSNCDLRHPIECRHGSACFKYECEFSHPNKWCTCPEYECTNRHQNILESLNWPKVVAELNKTFTGSSSRSKSSPEGIANTLRRKIDETIKRVKKEVKNTEQFRDQFESFWTSIRRAFDSFFQGRLKFNEFNWLVKRELFRIEKNRLPALALRGKFEQLVQESQAVIVRGQTGSGKSTQLTQYMAELSLINSRKKVICTQPRKLAAVSLAERVAYEYSGHVDDLELARKYSPVGKYVGYRVGGRSLAYKKSTLIEYYTEEKFLNSFMSRSLNYSDVFAVVVDEAHERNINTDIIMGILKRDLHENPHLKVVITSATIDPRIFSSYFFDCPTLEIPGRTFPVEILYSPPLSEKTSEDMVEPTVAQAFKIHLTAKNGDILCFLTGQNEVERAKEWFEKLVVEKKAPECLVLTAYGRQSPEEQSKLFEKSKLRKVVFLVYILIFDFL